MDKAPNITLGSEATVIGKARHRAGHWGNHGNGDNGWVGYLIVVGIFMVSFLFLILFT